MLRLVGNTTFAALAAHVTRNANVVQSILQPTGAVTPSANTFDYWDAILLGRPATAMAMKSYARYTKVAKNSFHAHTSQLTNTGRAPYGLRRFVSSVVAPTHALATKGDTLYFTANFSGTVHIISLALADVMQQLRKGTLRIQIVAVPANVRVDAVAENTTTRHMPTPANVVGGRICIGGAEAVTWEYIQAAVRAGATCVCLKGSLTKARELATATGHSTTWSAGSTFTELAHDHYTAGKSLRGTPMVTVDTVHTECERYNEQEYMLVRADTLRNVGKQAQLMPSLQHIAVL
jgi:hypothetical protein